MWKEQIKTGTQNTFTSQTERGTHKAAKNDSDYSEYTQSSILLWDALVAAVDVRLLLLLVP